MAATFPSPEMKSLQGFESGEHLRSLARDGRKTYLSAYALGQFIRTFLEDSIGPDELQAIADALECDNVSYEPAHAALIAKTLFEISTPEINGEIEFKKCAEMWLRLQISLGNTPSPPYC